MVFKISYKTKDEKLCRHNERIFLELRTEYSIDTEHAAETLKGMMESFLEKEIPLVSKEFRDIEVSLSNFAKGEYKLSSKPTLIGSAAFPSILHIRNLASDSGRNFCIQAVSIKKSLEKAA